MNTNKTNPPGQGGGIEQPSNEAMLVISKKKIPKCILSCCGKKEVFNGNGTGLSKQDELTDKIWSYLTDKMVTKCFLKSSDKFRRF